MNLLPTILIALSLGQSPDAASLQRAALDSTDDSAVAAVLLRRAVDAFDIEIAAAASDGERIAPVRNRARCLLALGDLGAAIASLGPYCDRISVADDRNRLREEIVWPADDESIAQARIDPANRPTVRLRRSWAAWGLWTAVWLGIWWRLGRGMSRREGVGWAVLLVGVLAARWFPADDPGVESAVVRESSVLRTGNGIEYPTAFRGSLPKGVEVAVVGGRGNWVQIRLVAGKVGWIERDRLVGGPPRRRTSEKSTSAVDFGGAIPTISGMRWNGCNLHRDRNFA